MRDRARTIVTCRKSLLGIHASLLSAFAVLAFTGCGGGGGGVTPSQPPSSSTSTLPTSSTAVVTAGPASQTATLTPIAGGYSGKVTIPVATGGIGSSLTFALSSTLPASVAAAPSVTPLVCVVVHAERHRFLRIDPGVFVHASFWCAFVAPFAFYLADYDPVTKVWQTILGPGVLNGQTVTFSPAGGSGNVMQGGSASVFVLFAAGPAVNITPIQQPTPYPFPITVNPNPIVFTAPNQSIDVTLSQAGYGGLFVTQNCTVYDTSAGSLGIGATSAPCPIQMSNLSNTIYRAHLTLAECDVHDLGSGARGRSVSGGIFWPRSVPAGKKCAGGRTRVHVCAFSLLALAPDLEHHLRARAGLAYGDPRCPR
jgi:hypothetical protein